MAINHNFYASASGIGPQTGGFNPTPADAISSSLRQNSSMGLMEYALYNDPRTRALSGLLATGLAGDSAQAANLIKNTAQGQLLKDISALAVSAGLVPGGSPTQLASNVQTMVASQGFNVGGNVGRGSPVFGGGAITDMMSRSIFDAVKNNFFDKVTGLPTKAAHGLNMSQMGEAMGQLTSRGAFRGMNIGDININEKGIYEFKRNEQQFEKVNKIFSDYAGMLKDARRIFGDLPIADLTQNAERLIGTSLREMGSVSAMRNRMANIQATSAAFGLNPAAVAERMMQVTDAVQSGMYGKSMQDVRMQNDPHLQAVTATAFGRIASDISEQAVLGGLRAGHSNAVASNLYAQQGKYMPVMEANQVTQMLAQGATEVLSDRDIGVTDNAIAAQAMLSSGRIKDPAARAKAQALITEMGKTGNIDKQAQLNQQLARVINASGADIDAFKTVHTTAEMYNMMSPEAKGAIGKFGINVYKNRLIEEGLKNLNTERQDYGLFRQDETGAANMVTFTKLFQDVDKEAQNALFAAVGAGGEIDEAALNKAYESVPGLAKAIPKDKFKDTIKQFAQDPGRTQGNLKDQLTGIMDMVRTNPRYQAGASTREEILSREREVQTYLASMSMGEPLSKEDFSTELMRGFFGAGKIDNQVVLESLKNKGKASTFAINASKTGLQLNEESLGKLSDTIGADNMAAVAAALNVDPSDKSALVAALNSPEGFKALEANLGGAAMAVTKDGLTIGSAVDIEKETKELETQSMVTAAQRLLGKDKQVTGDLTSVEGRAQYNKDILGELTRNKGAKLQELAGKFQAGGYGGQEFEALSLMAQSNPNIRKAIRDSAREAYAQGGEENIKKGNELMSLDRQLMAAGDGGGKFLGVLEIMNDSFSQMKLFQQ